MIATIMRRSTAFSIRSLGTGVRQMCSATSYASTSSAPMAIKLTEEGDVITIEAVPPTSFVSPVLSSPSANPHGACPLCRLNVTVQFDDVLILRQFMRDDGTVLPKEVTGVCYKQQQVVERAVMQAHWSGLFPSNKVPDNNKEPTRDYKMFKRYWRSHRNMYDRVLEQRRGTWNYIKRHERFHNPYHVHQQDLNKHNSSSFTQ